MSVYAHFQPRIGNQELMFYITPTMTVAFFVVLIFGTLFLLALRDEADDLRYEDAKREEETKEIDRHAARHMRKEEVQYYDGSFQR